MNNKPLVSVIMGTYNAEDTLIRAVDSIVKQTYTNWEFIICDDGSTDNTKKLLREIEANNTNIFVLENDHNMRLAFTLNQCLKRCKGKYVARMDADDISLPERIEKQVEFLENNPEYDVVGSNRLVFDENGDVGVRGTIPFPTAKDMLYGPPFGHPTIMMKKKVYDDLGGYTVSENTMRAEDLDLWFRFFASGYRAANLQEVLLKYQELSTDFRKRSIKAGIGTAKVMVNGFQELKFPKYKYLYAFKPIISAILPRKMMFHYQHMKLDKE